MSRRHLPRGRGPHRARPGLIAGTVLLGFSLVWFVLGFFVAYPSPVIGWVPLPLLALLAADACRRAGRHPGLDAAGRRFWRHVTLACALMAVAVLGNARDSLGAPGDLRQHIGPATAGLYLTILGLGLWALLRLPTWQRTRFEWLRFGLDTGVVLVASGVLIWHFSLGRSEAWAARSGSAPLMLSMVMIGAVTWVAFAKVAFAGAGLLDRRSLHLLGLGTGLSTILGGMMPYVAPWPQLNTALVSVPFALFGAQLAAARQRDAAPGATVPERRRWVLTVLPYLAVAGMDVLLLGTGRPGSADDLLILAGTVAITALVVLRQVITLRENKRLQAELAHQVRHDPLTGTANRAGFTEDLTARLAAGEHFLIALLDLDDFKQVNDRLGHRTGDALLCEVSARLAAGIRAGDTLARLGGDEFALLLRGSAGDDAGAVLDRLGRVTGVPVRADGHELVPRISIGVAPGRPGDTAGELLRRADVAMYAAKRAGGGRRQWFDEGLDRRAEREAYLSAELRRAVERDQLTVLYQPVVELPGGRLAGVEALLRWRHPELGAVSPAEFIPLAERDGSILELGRWVFDQVVAQTLRWQATHGAAAPGRVSVNISARQLREPGFVAEVAATLDRTGVDPSVLVAEVTETAVLGTGAALEAVRGLKALGLRVALDDFGTGQSSLSLLVDCPADILKVDKSFVDGVTGSGPHAVVVDHLASITAGLRMLAVAEGVETADQARRLYEAGYRYAQGFHFARPMSSADLTALLTAVPAARDR